MALYFQDEFMENLILHLFELVAVDLSDGNNIYKKFLHNNRKVLLKCLDFCTSGEYKWNHQY